MAPTSAPRHRPRQLPSSRLPPLPPHPPPSPPSHAGRRRFNGVLGAPGAPDVGHGFRDAASSAIYASDGSIPSSLHARNGSSFTNAGLSGANRGRAIHGLPDDDVSMGSQNGSGGGVGEKGEMGRNGGRRGGEIVLTADGFPPLEEFHLRRRFPAPSWSDLTIGKRRKPRQVTGGGDGVIIDVTADGATRANRPGDKPRGRKPRNDGDGELDEGGGRDDESEPENVGESYDVGGGKQGRGGCSGDAGGGSSGHGGGGSGRRVAKSTNGMEEMTERNRRRRSSTTQATSSSTIPTTITAANSALSTAASASPTTSSTTSAASTLRAGEGVAARQDGTLHFRTRSTLDLTRAGHDLTPRSLVVTDQPMARPTTALSMATPPPRRRLPTPRPRQDAAAASRVSGREPGELQSPRQKEQTWNSGPPDAPLDTTFATGDHRDGGSFDDHPHRIDDVVNDDQHRTHFGAFSPPTQAYTRRRFGPGPAPHSPLGGSLREIRLATGNEGVKVGAGLRCLNEGAGRARAVSGVTGDAGRYASCGVGEICWAASQPALGGNGVGGGGDGGGGCRGGVEDGGCGGGGEGRGESDGRSSKLITWIFGPLRGWKQEKVSWSFFILCHA